MGKIVYYDKRNDIFSVHKGFSSDEKFRGNISIDDLILDVSTAGRIRGIEIMNATRFFKEFEIGSKELGDVIDAKLNASVRPTGIIIGLRFRIKNKKQELPAKIAVPLRAKYQIFRQVTLDIPSCIDTP